MLSTRFGAVALLLLLSSAFASEEKKSEKFLPGGPLAGVKLPPNPRDSPSEGVLYHEFELYPGSVEHYRDYWMKYVPTRSFFDVQSQLKNFPAEELAKLSGRKTEEFAEPVYKVGRDSTVGPTGETRAAVPVLRGAAGMKPITLDLGRRGPGMYCLRVVGAAETDKLKPFREPLYVTWTVNDGDGTKPRTLRRPVGYVDEFYSMEEMYFHLEKETDLRAEFSVADGSKVDLLVSNILLDDVLAGVEFRPMKTKQTIQDGEELTNLRKNFQAEGREAWLKKNFINPKLLTLSPEERLARDERLWNRFLPTQLPFWNHGFVDLDSRLRFSTPDLDADAFEQKYGVWVNAANDEDDTFLANEKLGLKYTFDDARNLRPLPAPWPYPNPAGYYWPDPKDPAKGHVVAPVPMAKYWNEIRPTAGSIEEKVKAWQASGEDFLARDAAVELIRWAYEFPAVEFSQTLPSMLVNPSFRGRDTRFRQKHHYFVGGEYTGYMGTSITYDKLFPYIQGNEELAKSVQRFIPWVKTSQDVIALLDAYIVQTTAKRILRYQWNTVSTAIAWAGAVLAAPEITEPWMNEWLGGAAHVYPFPLAGLQDLTSSGSDRNGVTFLGSTFYCEGDKASTAAQSVEVYTKAVPTAKFNLSDPVHFPKPLASVEWCIGNKVGGYDFQRIGDVGGPEKQPGRTLPNEGRRDEFRAAWEATKDPRYAWVLVNSTGRAKQSDAEWAEVEKAAKTVPRAPWLENRSRFLPNWAGILEAGVAHDDWRFRRAAYVRTGVGTGHAHNDALDLQYFAHGIAWMPDDGQRGGYTKPRSGNTTVHNLVQVNNTEFGGRAWVPTLSDATRAPYLRAKAAHPETTLFERQIALIDGDEGVGSQPLTAQQQQYNQVLSKIERTPNSYVFDVFRVEGGSTLTYGIHGMGTDFTWNVNAAQPPKPGGPEEAHLKPYSETQPSWKTAPAPAYVQATWKIPREWEMAAMQKTYDPALPQPYQRVHLLQTEGKTALYADIFCMHLNYKMGNLMVQSRGENLSEAFPAIIECYRGEPFLKSVESLAIPNNEKDARKAVAVRVLTTSGHEDVCFTDGRPESTRQVGDLKVSGQYAYYSKAGGALRQASLTGGTLFETPEIKITVAEPSRRAKILEVDYLKRTLRIDTPWPAMRKGEIVEIAGLGDYRTTYTIASIKPQGNEAIVEFTETAEMYRSGITQVLPESKRVDGVIETIAFSGVTQGPTATNDSKTKSWKVTNIDNNDFTLDGAVTREDFAPSDALRIWEYGVGDTLQQTTWINLYRKDDGTYFVEGNVDAEITFGGKTRKITAGELAAASNGVAW